MRGLTEINKLNTLASIAKEQFLARATNGAEQHPKKQDEPWLGKVLRDAKKARAKRPAWAKAKSLKSL